MALNASGPISLGGTVGGQSIAWELGLNPTAQISMNDSAVRTLFGVASGAIAMSNGFGKSNKVSISYAFTASTADASLNVSTISGYSPGNSDITITVNSGIYLYATSTANAGLTLTGGTTGDTITLVNNGYIMGKGGTGGSVNTQSTGTTWSASTAGGNALSVGFNITINNTNPAAYIGGGGGGGAAGAGTIGVSSGGGGGAGGGNGGSATWYAGTYAGGAGGGIGSAGGTGVLNSPGTSYSGGGAGGRVFPGTGGVTVGTTAAGVGGTSGGGGGILSKPIAYASGNYGGSANGAGGTAIWTGVMPVGIKEVGAYAGGGGGWGATGGSTLLVNSFAGVNPAVAGSPGGKAVNLNGNTVTWISGNTTRIFGAVA